MENMRKPPKRNLNKGDQQRYWESFEWDEYELAMNGIRIPRDETHEILHGHRKEYSVFNMINLTRENHLKAHASKISKKDLFIAKARLFRTSDVKPSDEIIREFDLQNEY